MKGGEKLLKKRLNPDGKNNMSWTSRAEIYRQIERHRKRPLIAYVTSKREGASTSMANDALPYIIEQLDALPKATKALDFLIVSYGGDPMVAWRIMTLIRQRVEQVSIMIPHSAYSAATLLALGGNEIIIHPNGHLGPVDMQIRSSGDAGTRIYSTEEISSFLDFVRENLRITDQEHIRILFELTCKEVGSLGIGFTARSSKLAVDLGERLLAMHMKDDDSGSKLRSIVQNLSRKFQSHSYPVNRKEAIDIGLAVSPDSDKKLEAMMWKVWLDIEEDLMERKPFHPLFELMASPEAPKLLSPVPQLDVPMCTDSGTNYQTSLEDAKTKISETIAPVSFTIKSAIIESSRLAHASTTVGKILACRTPDLVVQYNLVTTTRGWDKQSTKVSA